MKISDVCRLTGLTQRTVRFYSEKGLISPKVSGKGSKQFRDYSEKDVELLNDIAALRSIDLSLDKILYMLSKPSAISDELYHHYHIIQERAEADKSILDVLEKLTSSGSVDVASLAQKIRTLESRGELPKRDTEPDFTRFEEYTDDEKRFLYLRFKEKKRDRDKKMDRISKPLKILFKPFSMLAYAVKKVFPPLWSKRKRILIALASAAVCFIAVCLIFFNDSIKSIDISYYEDWHCSLKTNMAKGQAPEISVSTYRAPIGETEKLLIIVNSENDSSKDYEITNLEFTFYTEPNIRFEDTYVYANSKWDNWVGGGWSHNQISYTALSNDGYVEMDMYTDEIPENTKLIIRVRYHLSGKGMYLFDSYDSDYQIFELTI
ncbi:MAG: MerR family transcriptional regulator [Ruminococcus sp.]|nr:MerR family transcriptional regulator [Ruminococcus sp.]